MSSPNIDVISDDPDAPGIADLVRGAASFGDIITRDRFSRAHLVAAGQVGGDAEALINSQMLAAAVDALAQSYDYLVIDAGAQSETALAPIVAMAPRAVLVGGRGGRQCAQGACRSAAVRRLCGGHGIDRPAAAARSCRDPIHGGMMATRRRWRA